ncbi:hypothetical protein ASPZODRAFT_135782 [Penicilliopsis zonata CBS 506.65]|uniref:ABC1 atypical kinase-like domain-containing protein n=1 Tax=Penicilliopsis zonata CBS 506.65 TaxID=1073090 RepID=A0A1L9S9C4_9EURO|nr:hypothetical protein ASPZODRAFT_135782 [Penicilliopsis zonata CBS 506.65]OJJ43761.1 hypothetical protein ASPZODRAFT_135782 [Penicilliopsis zonata CBS 506.65]
MSGRRLLDAIQLLNVAKSVAAKHLGVRQHQLDIYTKTSSLTKGVKNQAEGLILTAKAAAALAKRFDETNSPSPTVQTFNNTTASPLSTSSAKQTPPDEAANVRSETNFKIPEITTEYTGGDEPAGLKVSPQQDVYYNRPQQLNTSVSSLPKVLIPKAVSESQEHSDKDINADVFSSPVDSGKKASPEEQELSEEAIGQIFHSPRVARIMTKRASPETTVSSVTDSKITSRFIGQDETLTPGGENLGATVKEMEDLGSTILNDQEALKTEEAVESLGSLEREASYQMTESRVPSSRLGRLWQYGGLATSMAFGAVGESFRRVTGSNDSGSIMFSAGNMERLVAKLSKMRGAALKLGQMLSIQDSKMLPEPIQVVLQRVQDRADYMPASQRDKVLSDNLGSNWRDLFISFDEMPIAAASIGQVHKAVLKKTGQPVAVKIQYPGVSDSIDSDLNNLSILLTASRLLPRGLYLDKTIANARTELAWECDYVREAESGDRFRELLKDDPAFVVPQVIPEASGKQVLTMELLEGVAVTKIKNITQEQRDWIGTQIMRLCLREITEFKYMQTDPNWTNFLYNAQTHQLELLDFGASREYPREFIAKYIRTLVAASHNDRQTCHALSIDLGYLTGYESQQMVDAHVTSILTLAEPFMESSPDIYDFSNQTITDRVRDLIPVMIRERLAPPPEETYSLHRKLSGAFLLCARLGSRVRCKDLFSAAVKKADQSGLSSD